MTCCGLTVREMCASNTALSLGLCCCPCSTRRLVANAYGVEGVENQLGPEHCAKAVHKTCCNYRCLGTCYDSFHIPQGTPYTERTIGTCNAAPTLSQKEIDVLAVTGCLFTGVIVGSHYMLAGPAQVSAELAQRIFIGKTLLTVADNSLRYAVAPLVVILMRGGEVPNRAPIQQRMH